jgi:hypothetical protein
MASWDPTAKERETTRNLNVAKPQCLFAIPDFAAFRAISRLKEAFSERPQGTMNLRYTAENC